MTGGGAAGGALLPAATFALCVLPLATHWSPGVAGYLWVGIVMSLALGGATAGVSGVDPRSPRVWPLLATTAPFAAVLAWGVCTLLWSATPSRSIALIALLLAGLAAVLPLLTVVRLPDVQVAPVLRAVAAAAVLGTLGYGLHYLLRPGGRLASPLGPGSAVHLPLTLAVAVLAGAALASTRPQRWLWAALAALGALLVLATSSRAAVLGLIVLLWVCVVRLARTWRAMLSAGAAALVATGLLALFLRGERPGYGLSDGPRWANTVRSLDALTDGGWPLLVGRGTGAVWPWLTVELGHGVTRQGGFVIPTRWGDLLYHPHSTLLGVLVELGPLALLLLLVTLAVVLGSALLVLTHPDPTRWLPAAALLATSPGLLVETYLFRGFPAAVVWWTVALVVVRWAAQDGARVGLSRLRRPTARP